MPVCEQLSGLRGKQIDKIGEFVERLNPPEAIICLAQDLARARASGHIMNDCERLLGIGLLAVFRQENRVNRFAQPDCL
ncbi:Hypothetical protein NGAL_HAMBI490_55850 [Neorhizobium galegae bv. officinalis]|nr:Hypothetical protein NGAL_HAMBI490_55850 [Neorhizobium galegae bv. officinalis]